MGPFRGKLQCMQGMQTPLLQAGVRGGLQLTARTPPRGRRCRQRNLGCRGAPPRRGARAWRRCAARGRVSRRAPPRPAPARSRRRLRMRGPWVRARRGHGSAAAALRAEGSEIAGGNLLWPWKRIGQCSVYEETQSHHCFAALRGAPALRQEEDLNLLSSHLRNRSYH
ncbi:succinate dehydrogenase assembly factor 4, mitochondrial isoform X1 [Falco peregrinus]|uniref:succinate dehydrogenase assembly factor 4, mitochondrial isoform X1 n=1 Tax=Falco peregrinus TaxID=8954 RepID=UPI0024798FE9|nr:succinate dehydrogenase assembly factor 4, mitochondrial isoform X1 [Falco peregrinus]